MVSFFKNSSSSDPIDFKALIEQGALIIDVRSPHEFSMEHVECSINIPLGELPLHLRDIKIQGKPVITCCRSGARANNANVILQQAGIEAYNIGSWNAVKELLN